MTAAEKMQTGAQMNLNYADTNDMECRRGRGKGERAGIIDTETRPRRGHIIERQGPNNEWTTGPGQAQRVTPFRRGVNRCRQDHVQAQWY